jgi:RES domain-containing protein
MTVYRLAEARHAHTTQDALSGEGAFLFGGRWNPPGYRVIYAAEHLSLAVLEVLVHIQDRQKLRDYHLITLDLSAITTEQLDDATLPDDYAKQLKVTQTHGEAWLKANRSAALFVPSVIIPGERNILINPLHADFARIHATEPVAFRFDSRLISL